ncbi:hypothetical protein ABZS88_00925 [Streptomyces sp. NPDC005480]|uniref:hypothetical protein n=1 Tax=Streptomyces sp. NPDC005480 TaxID=3154880 RepID=UPI0033B3CD24
MLRRDRAVVEYDPKQPWRVVVTAGPPGEWRARALRLDPAAGTKTGGSARGLPPGLPVLDTGAAGAGLLPALVGPVG